jgi:hypothetical protein
MTGEPVEEITARASLEGKPVFGDPEWIARRGPLKPRKWRIRRSKPRKKERCGVELWFLIDGRAVRLRCSRCRPGREWSAHRWRILSRGKVYAEVVCEAGHRQQCFAGFYFERPEGG